MIDDPCSARARTGAAASTLTAVLGTGSSRRGHIQRAAVTAVVLAIGLLATSCGGSASRHQATSPFASRPRVSIPGSSSPTSIDPTSAAVLAAYRASSAAFEQALATANAADPALAATMVDPQLQSVKANLLADQRQGIVGRGTVTLHPKVVAISGSTATVVDCVYSTSELVYEGTGKPVPPVTPPENDGIRATLDLTGGAWKLAKQTVTEGSCAPGS